MARLSPIDVEQVSIAAQSELLESFREIVALVDKAGVIVAVNAAWREFGNANSPDGSFPSVGTNYLSACDKAGGGGASDGQAVAAGIRSVLEGASKEFILEYPCHSPTAQHWFRLIVSPIRIAEFRWALVMHVDITTHKLTALRLLEYQMLIEAASRVSRLGAWRLDYPGPVVTWSDDVRAIYEVPLDFFPTVDEAIRFYAPRYRDVVRGAVRACLEHGTPFDFKAQLVTANGRLIWVRVIGECVRDTEGKITALQGAFQDIDAMEREHAQLARMTKTMTLTFDNMSEALTLLDKEWRIVYMNVEAQRLGRIKCEDALGRLLWEVYPESKGNYAEQQYRSAVRENRAVKFEIFYEPLGHWFEINAVPSLEGLAIFYMPVTERKKAEETLARQAELLRSSEEQYRLLFAANPQPMWVIDKDSFAFLAVNSAATRHYGYSEQEFLAMSALDIRPPTDVPRFLALMGKEEQPLRTEIHEHRRKDGTIMLVEVTASMVTFADRPARMALIHDVTSKVQAEREARRAQRLESVGTLAGGLAHDINNLLSPIKLGLSIVRERTSDADTLEALSTMESNARRASEIVQRLLAFARGTESFRLPVEIREPIREVANIARNTFPKNITITTTVASDLPPTLADATQIHQVLLNLCLNARDAMPNGGRLGIAASRVKITELGSPAQGGLAPGAYVLIEVTDTGEGIAPDLLERIFEPFFTTKPVGHGSGLGLSSALGIIKSHEGYMQVASRPGKGSTFQVYLPALAGAVSHPPREDSTAPRGHGELILLVDDETAILDITSRVLRAFGYKVVTADDATRAIGVFATHMAEVSVVMTDIMMPGMDGYSLITTLRKMLPTVRIIASSGQNAPGQKQRAISVGATGFLPKPYSAEDMLRTIAETLGPATLR